MEGSQIVSVLCAPRLQNCFWNPQSAANTPWRLCWTTLRWRGVSPSVCLWVSVYKALYGLSPGLDSLGPQSLPLPLYASSPQLRSVGKLLLTVASSEFWKGRWAFWATCLHWECFPSVSDQQSAPGVDTAILAKLSFCQLTLIYMQPE